MPVAASTLFLPVNRFLLVVALVVAACGPSLLAASEPPSPTVLNQLLAVGAWGGVLLVLPRSAGWRHAWSAGRPLLGVFLLLAASAIWSAVHGVLPWSLSGSALGMCAAAALVFAAGTAARPTVCLWQAFFGAWVLAGIASAAVGITQVFLPQWVDGDWIAQSQLSGRAVGNLRQPNHMATLLLWAAISTVGLLECHRSRATHAHLWAAVVSFVLLLFSLVLTGSRTGLAGTLLLVAWGVADRRLTPLARQLLIGSPLICAASWWVQGWLAGVGGGAPLIGAATRTGEGMFGTSRYDIWGDALALIRDQPWFGAGFGEFNFAWTLTPLARAPSQFVDNAHNLPLHLMVELGVPLGVSICALLLWAVWRAWRSAAGEQGVNGAARRAALLMVLVVGLHSLLEYPLWYAYFLLPAAMAWGLSLSSVDESDGLAPAASSTPAAKVSGARHVARVGGVLLVVGALCAWWDYQRVARIFEPGAATEPLATRITDGRRSWFFAHHADYAYVTTADTAVTEASAFARATHYLLDARLMIAWSRSLMARGDADRARHVAVRLRALGSASAAAFFSECDDTPAENELAPFQCGAPQQELSWRSFLEP